jgi:hypothetical protein
MPDIRPDSDRGTPGQGDPFEDTGAFSEPSADLPPSSDGPFPQVFGRYVLRQRLGRGGMGTVYLALDTRLDRDVALKTPHPHLLANGGLLDWFYREARAAARLSHPNLCPVLDIDVFAGVHYFTMPFIAGDPLSARAPECPNESLRLVQTLARAMAEAHRLGVIHRDLKESNVLITPAGQPVVTDFGLALCLDRPNDRLTEPGVPVGTAHYMSPEQVRADAQALGPACDVYALGVILYRLLTRRLPFEGQDRDRVYQRILNEAPVRPSWWRADLPPAVDALCMKALAKRQEDRFATMLDFADAIGEALGAAATTPAPPRPLVSREAIRFLFVGLGEQAPPASGPRDRLYLDVGNDLRPGVIDHHHLAARTGATAGLVLAHARLIDEAVACPRRPDDPFTIVLHEKPDLDAVASAFLAVAYLTTGDFPKGAEALARYVDRIDEGGPGMTLSRPFSLYAGYLQLANRVLRRSWNSSQEQWQECVRRGLELTSFVLERVARSGTPLPAVDAFACPDLFDAEDRAEVRRDIERYERKLADPHCQARRAVLHLPGQLGGWVDVPALLVRGVQDLDDPERCVFFKDWARSDAGRAGAEAGGFSALCVFMPEGARQKRRCILSVRPDSEASLRGLAEQLERAESSRRRQVYGRDDRVTDPTTGAPRPSRPGYANADPWYDGRAHAYTIVDAPRGGTLLTSDEIEGIFLLFGSGRQVQPLAAPLA